MLSRVDQQAMLNSLKALSGKSLALALSCFAANILIKAFRWRRMLVAQTIELPTSVVFAAYLSGQFYGQVTIGRLGEFYRAEALTERSVSVGRAISSCLFDRMLDVLIVLFLAVVLGTLVTGNTRAVLVGAGIIGVSVAVGAFVVIEIKYGLLPQKARSWFALQLMALEQKRVLGRFIKEIRELLRGATFLLRPIPLFEALFWSAIAWTGYFATLWQLSIGIGCRFSVIVQTAAASLAALTTLLPITISGLGVREIIFAQVLSIEGATMEQAVLLSLMNLAVMIICALGLGTIGLVWRGRQHL